MSPRIALLTLASPLASRPTSATHTSRRPSPPACARPTPTSRSSWCWTAAATRTSRRSSPASTTRACASSATSANRGIAEAYNTIIREARGELIAMLGDDDVCEPDRIARQVAVFDRHPDTGVAHGAGVDHRRRRACSAARGPARTARRHELLRHLVREHNTLVDPSRMVHRRVYEAVGGYDAATSASPRTSTSGCAPCAPSASATCRAARSSACAATAKLLRRVRAGPRDAGGAERPALAHRRRAAARARARARLGRHAPRRGRAPRARGAGRRPGAPRPAAARASRASCAPRAARVPAAAAPAPQRPQDRPHLVRLQRLRRRHHRPARGRQGARAPRLGRHRLPRRHAARPLGRALRRARVGRGRRPPVGIHNRQHGLWDLGNPLRELDDPPITQAFARAAGPRAPGRRALPQPAQPRRRAHRRGRRARPAELLLDPQLLADLPARLPAHRRRRDLRRPRRPRPRLRLVRRRPARHRRPPAAPGGHPRPLHARRLGVPRRLRRDARAPSPARTTRST